MRSLHIAWSLIKIPHLALSLFLFPLMIGLVIVAVQSFVTAMFVTVASRDSATEVRIDRPSQNQNIARFILFGDVARRPDPIICRWTYLEGKEIPPSRECEPDRLDIAIRVLDPIAFDPSHYVKLFSGNVDRIHLCKTCSPDVIIEHPDAMDTTTRAYSLYGALLSLSPFWNEEAAKAQITAKRIRQNVSKTLGSHFLQLPEVPNGIKIIDLGSSVPVALNIALFVIVALWLALKAHRKVLDYFARNDVLLPLVAACGKDEFYGALWILTGFRVVSFLVSGITLVVLGFYEILVRGVTPLVEGGVLGTFIWLATLISSLAFVALLGSIAELKHRQHMMIFLLRYVPITVSIIDAIFWAASLLSTGELGPNIRLLVSALPILGTVPILVAPTLNIPSWILLIHGLAALGMCFLIARSNSRWFAAHLDEI